MVGSNPAAVADLAQCKADLEDLRKEKGEVEADHNTQKVLVKGLKADLQDRDRAAESLQRKADELQNRVDELEDDNAGLEEDLEKEKKALSTVQAMKEEFSQASKEAEARTEEIQAKYEAADDKLAETTAKLQTLETEAASSKEGLATYAFANIKKNPEKEKSVVEFILGCLH